MITVISGGSSGIGKATATLFAEAGHTVYELSRSGQAQGAIQHLACDVTNEAEVNAAIAEIGKREGKIDRLIANAGFGIAGPFEATPEDDLLRQYDVNVFGAARLVKAAFPYLKAAGNARVLFISSVAADIPIPFQTHYSASKACLKAFALGLDNEWRPHGIRALALMPGDIKTGFTAGRVKIGGDARAERSVAKMEKDEVTGQDVRLVAKRIYQMLIKKRAPKVAFSFGLFYQAALTLVKLLPVRLANFVIGKLYSA